MELGVLKAATRTAVIGSIGALAIVLAGCSSSSQQATAGGSPAATSSAGTQGGGQAGGQGGRFGQNGTGAIPGTFGLIAEVDGTTLQVQSQSEQTAVSYTSKTSIEQIKAVSSKDIAAGWCAVVVSSARQSASPGTLPSKITATTVSLTKATSSGCGFGGAPGQAGGFGGRARPSGAPTNFPGRRPTARPTNRPGGAPNGRAGGFGTFASGRITKVSGSGFVIDAVSRVRGSQSSQPSPSTKAVTVSVSGSTKITMQQTAKSSAIKQGECVRATGKADSTGAVAATGLVLSSATNGTCTPTGFGGFGGRRGGTNG